VCKFPFVRIHIGAGGGVKRTCRRR
jgi:hypothetical protein